MIFFRAGRRLFSRRGRLKYMRAGFKEPFSRNCVINRVTRRAGCVILCMTRGAGLRGTDFSL